MGVNMNVANGSISEISPYFPSKAKGDFDVTSDIKTILSPLFWFDLCRPGTACRNPCSIIFSVFPFDSIANTRFDHSNLERVSFGIIDWRLFSES